ncbi:Secreted repeat of unknown function [Staphylothermus marinus F1]|uniref:Lipoprotein n=1 Tax=Staphylothermus marinus (strain ATCC 43588 / DSM 3639 / JCM 9404 / F1) TaxID=399550 RepID=A3DM13_STAMF|nr:hypothetical protein [Staphylothermus marinus]ABN69673.1 Secreted repeat of unknown function [Staphylothermus marinus F1]
MPWNTNVSVLIGILIVGLVVGLLTGYMVGSMSGYGAPTTSTITRTSTTTVTQTMTQTKYMEYDVKLAYSEEYGLYLVDSEGRTLYFFAKDYNGSSSCYGACAEHWPIFYVENPKVGPGLDPNDFGVITRNDGSKQLTYKGWPLYYFAGDEKPGDINGDGVKNVWFVAKPDYTIMIAVKPGLGAYLTDSKGMTLYFFAKDVNGTSNCYGTCAENWPPFMPKHLVVPSILNLTDFSFIRRSDGGVQLVYKGYPLYYWINDEKMGDTTGHGVKNVWSVAFVEGAMFSP